MAGVFHAKKFQVHCHGTISIPGVILQDQHLCYSVNRRGKYPAPCKYRCAIMLESSGIPVSFRFIRGTLRTSLRSICLLRDRRFVLDETDPLQVSRNMRQHVLDFLDNDARNEPFLCRGHSNRIVSPYS